MSPFLGVLLLVLLIIGIAILMSTRDRVARKRITEAVQSAGGEVIDISSRLFLGDRFTFSYVVRFSDRLGAKYEASCRVNVFEAKPFWEHSPAELLADQPEVAFSHLAVGDSKEQIISDLSAENEWLRQELLRQQRAEKASLHQEN